MEMFKGMAQRIGVKARRWMDQRGQLCPQLIHTSTQAFEEGVDGGQAKEWMEILGGGPNGEAAQPIAEQLPKQRRVKRVAWQRIGDEDGEGSAATGALSAIGTKHPLTSLRSTFSGGGVVTEQNTVAVECADYLALRARQRLERKRWVSRASLSFTKWSRALIMASGLTQLIRRVEFFIPQTRATALDGGTHFREGHGKGGTALRRFSKALTVPCAQPPTAARRSNGSSSDPSPALNT